MRRAGYADTGYTLVLASYASPFTERMIGVPAAQGCPYSRADAGWARTVAFPQLSAALREVAEESGVRFLDLSRATEGREACSQVLADDEWQRRLTVDPNALVYGGLDAIGATWRRSRSTPRRPGTRSWGAASASSCAATRCRRRAGWGRTGGCTRRRGLPVPPASAA